MNCLFSRCFESITSFFAFLVLLFRLVLLSSTQVWSGTEYPEIEVGEKDMSFNQMTEKTLKNAEDLKKISSKNFFEL